MAEFLVVGLVLVSSFLCPFALAFLLVDATFLDGGSRPGWPTTLASDFVRSIRQASKKISQIFAHHGVLCEVNEVVPFLNPLAKPRAHTLTFVLLTLLKALFESCSLLEHNCLLYKLHILVAALPIVLTKKALAYLPRLSIKVIQELLRKAKLTLLKIFLCLLPGAIIAFQVVVGEMHFIISRRGRDRPPKTP